MPSPDPSSELQADVLDRREEGKEVVGLEDQPDLVPAHAGAFRVGQGRDLSAPDRHASCRGGVEAADQAEQGRLPAAARPCYGKATSGLHVEAYAVDRLDHAGGGLISLRDVFQLDACARVHRSRTSLSSRTRRRSARAASSWLWVTNSTVSPCRRRASKRMPMTCSAFAESN